MATRSGLATHMMQLRQIRADPQEMPKFEVFPHLPVSAYTCILARTARWSSYL